MVLADTSAWIACARFGDPLLEGLIQERRVVGHGVVSGELSLGCGPTARRLALTASALPQAPEPSHAAVRAVVDGKDLGCCGLSWSDASLVASALAAGGDGASLVIYTHDRTLAGQAARLGVGWS